MRLPRIRLPRQVSLVAVVFSAIGVAAAVLGWYGYRQSTDLARLSEEAIRSSHDAIADRVVSVIEKEIITADHALFNLIDLANLRTFPERWREIVRLSPRVEAVVVMDAEQKIVASSARGGRERRFRNLFERRIRPDLKLASLVLGEHAHLHAEVEGEQVLISYTHRQAPGADYFIALSIDIDTVIETLLPHELESLRESARFSVVDTSGRVIYGDRLAGSPFLVESRFPSTLWRWRLQMAPRNVWELASQSHRRRTADLARISLSLSLIAVGMFILLLAIRKERRASALKSEFIANVSHELKTPLSLIRMFGELLALGKVSGEDKAREYAEIITRESERLGRLIDNVLDFARIERGKAAYEFRTGDLAEVVERCLDVYRHRLERERIRLEVELAPDLPPLLLDDSAMTLALLNLIENAVKYAGPGEVIVRIAQVGAEVQLSVQDHGPGIPEAEQRRIFDRFYRAKGARGRNVRGSGIGLSLVKHIAEAHGGRVILTSEVGKGATFTLCLPVMRAPLHEPEPVSQVR